MQLRWSFVFGILGVAALALTGCAPAVGPDEPARTQAVATTAPDEAASPEPTQDPFPGWTTYAHPVLGLSFRYPSTWFGPDVYEFEGGLRLEVGSDVVYPYGTGLDERQPGKPNAYNVVIQYTRNTSGLTLEQARAEQSWLNEYLALLDGQDGQTSGTARSSTRRVRGLTIGAFNGVELTTTLPETAQTERFFVRTVFLVDESLNVVLINGQPINVEIVDPASWRAAFETLDAANLEIFRALVESIRVE